MIKLLDDATANGDGTITTIHGFGHQGTLHIFGTWDGATVSITGSLDGGTTYDAPTDSVSEFTEDTLIPFKCGDCKVKATISGKGSSTSLNAYLSI